MPSAVKSVKVDTLYGLESVEEEILEIMPLYQAGREEIRHLYAVHGKLDANESGHDALHTLRVLFNALLLVEMDAIMLSEEETQMLMDAVIYHDIGRTNDYVDDSHGKASRDIYAADRKPENPGTGFLIEYHCLDDAVARRDLELFLCRTLTASGCCIRFSKMPMRLTGSGSGSGTLILNTCATIQRIKFCP